MFSRRSTAERTAAQAWDYLSSAVATAGDSARSVGVHTARSAGRRGARFVDAAGDTSSRLADEAGRRISRAGRRSATLTEAAGSRAGSIADEAMRRANLAADALAGRRPGLPWALLVGVGLAGVTIGWVAATTARAALARRAENDELELAENPATPMPTFET